MCFVKMDALVTKFLFFCVFLFPIVHSSRRELVSKIIDHELMNFPTTTQVTNPVTVTVSPDTSSSPAGIITVPAATPVTTVTPTPPPSTNLTTPVTNPVTNNPANQPVTTSPVVAPPVATANAPPAAAVAGQSWCVAKSGVPETSLQAGLDYACGIGKADCSAIQQGASCYNPNALQNHASYAFNSYYQKNPLQTSCDFGATAVITHVNPSSGSCIFPTSSSSSTASPVSTTPTPTPTTASSSGTSPIGSLGTPPMISNASDPTFGGATTGFGESPLAANTSVSSSSNLKPFISYVIVVTYIINGVMILV